MEFTRPRGTRDFLFDEMRQRKKAESTLRNIFENYGYQEIKTPLFEELKLFTTKSGEEIVNAIEQLKPQVRASFIVDTLTFLHRGGRCSGVAALAGGALKLHPKIIVENGGMKPDKKYRFDEQKRKIYEINEISEYAKCKNIKTKHRFIVGYYIKS